MRITKHYEYYFGCKGRTYFSSGQKKNAIMAFFDKYDIMRIPFSELYKRDVPSFLSEEKNSLFYSDTT